MPVRPTLLHRMALVSFLLFRKNLGNLREFLGKWFTAPPWQKIARTPMLVATWKYNFIRDDENCIAHDPYLTFFSLESRGKLYKITLLTRVTKDENSAFQGLCQISSR